MNASPAASTLSPAEESNALIKRCQAGDKQAFSQLFSENKALIECAVSRLVKDRNRAEDVIQEVLLRVYRNINSFNHKCKPSTWIYRIAINEGLRHLSTRYGKGFLGTDILESLPSNEPGAMQSMVEEEERETVRKMMNTLPPEYRNVLTLYYYGSMSIEEIASRLNIPAGTVASRIARAREALRGKLVGFSLR